MFGKVASIVVLSVLAVQLASALIIHVKLNDDHLIKVGPETYALIGPILSARNLSSIVVDGQSVKGCGFECEQTVTNLTALSPDDKKAMEEVRRHLDNVASPSNPLGDNQKYVITLYSAHNHHIGSTVGVKSSIHQVDQYRVVVHDDEYSIVSVAEPLPFDWLIYFVFTDRIAFVNNDLGLQVMPIKCLPADQISFVSEVAKKLVDAKVMKA